MSVGPFPVTSVITRLAGTAPLRLVGNAADLAAALKATPNAAPAAFVLADERGGPVKGFAGGPQIQNSNVTVKVVLFVRNVSAADRGGGARKEMDDLVIPAVRGRLLAWAPSDVYLPLSFVASRDESYDAGWLVVQELYACTYRISATAQP